MVLLEECEQGGCQIEFLDQPMGQDPQDHLLVQIRGAVAEYERTLIADGMRRGRQMKLQAGILLPWTVPPYGYRVHPERPRDPAGVQIEPTEGAIVQELFVRYLEDGGTLLGLAKDLLQRGMKSPRGNPRGSTASLHGLLSNPAYTGKLYVGRTHARPARLRRSATHPLGKPAHSQDATPPETWTFVTHIPALVSQDVFDRVQAKLALNKQRASRNNKAHRYVLRALVSCGVCQSACIARTTQHGHSYSMCRCAVQPIYSQHDQRCKARYSPAQQLDALVWQDLCELRAHPESIVSALERAHGGHWLPQELQARKDALRKGQGSLTHQLERLTEAYLQGVIPLSEYQRRRQDLEQKQHALEIQEKQLEVQGDRHNELAGMAESITAFCQRVRTGLAHMTFAQQRTLVELLIDRVLVANGDVEIRYAIPTHPRGEMTRFCQLRKDYFDNVIQIFHLADDDRRAVLLIVAFDGGFIGVTAVNRNLLGDSMTANGLLEKLERRLFVAMLGQQKVNRLAGFVYGSVEVVPLTFDLKVGLIHPPADPHRPLAPMERLFQGRTVFDDPALDSGVIDLNPALLHQFF